MNVNGDHWEDERGKVEYILSRLIEKVLKYTLRRRLKGTINPYRIVDNVLEHLVFICEDPHQKEVYFKSATQLATLSAI